MPLQCGTWKKRLRAVTGPICTGSNRTSKRDGRVVAGELAIAQSEPSQRDDRHPDSDARHGAIVFSSRIRGGVSHRGSGARIRVGDSV